MPTLTTDDRKASILEAVVGVIIDVGFTEMTVADVAKRAGVSSALVHYHFSSKLDLITVALQTASDDDKRWRQAIAAGPGPAIDRLEETLCGSLPADADDASWLLWIESWGESRRQPVIGAVMADLDAHEAAVIIGLIGEVVADERFRCPDPAAASARLTALRDGLAIQHTLFGGDHSAAEFVELLRQAIRREVDQ